MVLFVFRYYQLYRGLHNYFKVSKIGYCLSYCIDITRKSGYRYGRKYLRYEFKILNKNLPEHLCWYIYTVLEDHRTTAEHNFIEKITFYSTHNKMVRSKQHSTS